MAVDNNAILIAEYAKKKLIAQVQKSENLTLSSKNFNALIENFKIEKINTSKNPVNNLLSNSNELNLKTKINLEPFFSKYSFSQLTALFSKFRGVNLKIDQQKKLQRILDISTVQDNALKYVLSKQHFSRKNVTYRSDHYLNFKLMFETFKNPTFLELTETQRANSKFFKFKFGGIVKDFIRNLSNEHHMFHKLLELSQIDLDNIFENVGCRETFEDLHSTTLLCMKKNLLNRKENKGKNQEMFEIKFQMFKYEYSFLILLTLLKHVLDHENQKQIDLNFVEIAKLKREYKTLVDNMPEMGQTQDSQALRVLGIKNELLNLEKVKFDLKTYLSLSYRYLLFNTSKYASEIKGKANWYATTLDVSALLINFFIESGNIETVLDWNIHRKRAAFQTKRILLDFEFKESLQQIFEFPRVCPPDMLGFADIVDAIKPPKFGDFNVSDSANLVKTMNLLERKRFKVNEKFLQILKDYYDKKSSGYSCLNELNFTLPNLREIEGMSEKIDDSKNFSIANSKIQNQISKDLEKKQSKIRFVNTRLKMAEVIKGLPLWFTNVYCARLRFYPKQYMISRTSGVLKHLIQDFAPLKLTNRGLLNLMKAYYDKDSLQKILFQEFVETVNYQNKKTFFKNAETFFKSHLIDFRNVKPAPYFVLLNAEIQEAFNTKYTATPIEIDQKASGISLLAFVTKTKSLAEKCNIINYERNDVYQYCQLCFPKFYEDFIEKKDLNVLGFFLNNRKIMKYTFMCYSYSQKSDGRFHDVFLDNWLEVYNVEPTMSEGQCLFEIANKFEIFLEQLFTNLTKKVEILGKIIQFVAKKNSNISIKTIDGVVISYDFFKKVEKQRFVFNPYTKKELSIYHTPFGKRVVKIQNLTDVGSKEFSEEIPIRDVKGHVRRFLSFFIHSLDAGILRIISHKFYLKTGYIPNTIHDCFLIHPNFLDSLYDCIKEVYSDPRMFTLVDDLVFTQLKNQLSEEHWENFDLLVKEFQDLTDDFQSELGNFEPSNLYDFE